MELEEVLFVKGIHTWQLLNIFDIQPLFLIIYEPKVKTEEDVQPKSTKMKLDQRTDVPDPLNFKQNFFFFFNVLYLRIKQLWIAASFCAAITVNTTASRV